jgi:hypothetical protein
MTTTTTLEAVPPPTFSASLANDPWDLNLAVFGLFEGINMPSARLEALLAAHVKKQHFADMAMVYESRWWDYRRLSPGHSFMLFNREYLKAMRAGARNFVMSRGPQRDKNGKVMTAGEVASFNKLYGAIFTKQVEADIWERGSQYIVGMFKAMVAADLFGIPYDAFCKLAIENALERQWDRVPQPWHLYNDRMCAETINLWQAECQHKLRAAAHPAFEIENYCGLKIQDDYRRWLIAQIEERGVVADPAVPLAVMVYHKRHLPEELAAAHFSEVTMRRAKALG